jgi:DNA polymerase elongation subunit (family B)
MKDVLEYTEDELRSLSTEELESLLHLAENGESLFDTRQLVEKTMINSLYGALANKWFPLFNEDMAAAITGNGRYFIQKLANYIEETLQQLLPQEKPYIVYGDTDSVYYHIEPFVEKYIAQNPGLPTNDYVEFADRFEKKVIQPVIEKTINDFAYELNAYNKDKIGAEREIIADAAVFTAKKKYYARVRDNEGTRYPDDSPKIKVMGLEIIKSSTPKWSQKYLKQAIPHILDKNEDDLRTWVNKSVLSNPRRRQM